MEKRREERTNASFLLKTRLQRARNLFSTDLHHLPTLMAGHSDMVEDDETYVTDGMGGVSMEVRRGKGSIGLADNTLDPSDCPSKSESGNVKYKAQFGRLHTHNEQTLVRPCGVVFARATMYGAEAVSNVLVLIKQAFSVPGARKPEHIFYNSNCDAHQQAQKDPWFSGIGMCVDVWHFKNKHKVSHEYCQMYCNPAQYPELMDEFGNWFFNTSVAEQTNAWLGRYSSICHEMTPVRFDFFS
ncbi:hypothetical protein H1R20_g9835, partial [Candolleomyces eurysporus]